MLEEVSEDGKYLLIFYQNPKWGQMIVNTTSDERVELPLSDGGFHFLHNDLMLGGTLDNLFLLDLKVNQRIEINDLDFQEDWNSIFGQAELIYLINTANIAVALDQNSNNGSTSYYGVNFMGNGNASEFITAENFPQEIILFPRNLCQTSEGCPSSNGAFLAINNLVRNKEGEIIGDISEITSTPFLGWATDDSGLFFNFGHGHLLEGGFAMPSLGNIPGGVAKLNIPEEYLD